MSEPANVHTRKTVEELEQLMGSTMPGARCSGRSSRRVRPQETARAASERELAARIAHCMYVWFWCPDESRAFLLPEADARHELAPAVQMEHSYASSTVRAARAPSGRPRRLTCCSPNETTCYCEQTTNIKPALYIYYKATFRCFCLFTTTGSSISTTVQYIQIQIF